MVRQIMIAQYDMIAKCKRRVTTVRCDASLAAAGPALATYRL
jgi:hypothetical protein